MVGLEVTYASKIGRLHSSGICLLGSTGEFSGGPASDAPIPLFAGYVKRVQSFEATDE